MPLAQATILGGIGSPFPIIAGEYSAFSADQLHLRPAQMDAAQQLASISNAWQNAYPVAIPRNADGQTFEQWRDGFEARIAMCECSGYPMKRRELEQWEAEAEEWRAIRGR